MAAKDHIDNLKKVRIPWWARLLGDYRARKRAKEARIFAKYHYRHVATVTQPGYWNAWFICKENGLGERTFEYTGGGQSSKPEDHWIYAHLVRPWALKTFSNEQLVAWANEQQLKMRQK